MYVNLVTTAQTVRFVTNFYTMSQKRRPKKKPAKKVVKKKPLKKKPIKKKVKTVTKPPLTSMEKASPPVMKAPDALRVWLQSNVELINITGWERKAAMPKTTLRQISSGKRELTRAQLHLVTNTILPELKIIVGILSTYDKFVFEKNHTPDVN